MTGELTLPDAVTYVRSTPEFNAATVPAGLLQAHQVAERVWGRLVVSEGSVDFTFEDTPEESMTITAGGMQVIPPSRPHHITVHEHTRFHIEFHREAGE